MSRRSHAMLHAVAVFTLLGTAWGQAVAVVVTAGPEGRTAMRYLGEQLDRPVVEKSGVETRRLEELVTLARREWAEEIVVVIDMDGPKVSVLRPRDGTVASRSLDPDAARAPYAVALAAVELIDLVMAAPVARAASLPPAVPPASPPKRLVPAESRSAPAPAVSEPPRPEGRRFFAPAVAFGVIQTLSSNAEIGLLQPTAGVDLQVGRLQRSRWYGVGLHFAGLTSQHHANSVPPATDSDGPGELAYRRDEVALRSQIGHRSTVGGAVAWANLGVSRINVTATDHSGNEILSDVHAAFWIGLGGELRYALAVGISAAIGAGLAWYPQRTRFLGNAPGDPEVVVFEEGGVEFRGRLGLIWEGPR